MDFLSQTTNIHTYLWNGPAPRLSVQIYLQNLGDMVIHLGEKVKYNVKVTIFILFFCNFHFRLPGLPGQEFPSRSVAQVVNFEFCLNLNCVHYFNTNLVWIHESEKIIWKQKQGKCTCLPSNESYIVGFYWISLNI